MTTSGNERNQIKAEIRRLETSNKLHKLKALQFYKRKKVAKFASRTDETREAICMDFAKNLPVPNITTNDVYYESQLSVYSFNIHVLSTAQSIFYVYPETVGGKGSDAICSMLHHFLNNFLDHRVKNLEIFCDSCGGQNKNYTLFRYIHHLVHFQGKLDSVKVSFPIRGHSYMECDKDFGLIKQKTVVELPSEWIQVFRASRVKPSPFDVLQVTQCYFRSWTTHMTSLYRKQCPFKTRPVRELRVVKDHPRFVLQRATWNGMWESHVIIDGRKLPLDTHEFELPGYLYKGMLPISAEKFKDLQCLKRFCCNPEADEFYSTLPHNQKTIIPTMTL